MPSASDFVPDFDNSPPVAAASQPAEPEDPWAFGKSPPKSTGKKKKKSKKDAAARQNRIEDGEDSSAYPKSITPSPPTHDGVQLERPVSPPAPPPQPVVEHSPLVNFDDDDVAPVEIPEPLPPPRPSPRPANVSPVVRSPRPVAARPVMASTPPSRPASIHAPAQRDRNNSLTGYRPTQMAQATQQRRESFVSPPPRFVDPPPPHKPQAHFFGLPDLGFNPAPKQENGKPAGSDGYCCRIDSLADAGDEASAKKARDALLVGCEGGLEVFRILPNKLEVVGRLEGLRGSVIGAKVLPHTEKFDNLQVFRPLIAVVVHGPMVEDQTGGGDKDLGQNDTPSHFQTTVEVYSLQTQHYIATLYSSLPVAIEQPVLGQVSSLPDPIGDLHIDAHGQFITVSSGKSGEIFVFTQGSSGGIEETRFRCIGKFWTSIQRTLSSSRPATSSEANGAAAEIKEEPRTPLYSLSPRWLAVVPPSNSQNISIQGVPLLSDVNPSPPGITTHAAPPQQLVTCEVVGTDVEGTWSRLGRQAAQGLVKYSQRGIEMGLQGWKELTQPSPPGGRSAHDRSSSKDDLFPPTKAPSDDQQKWVAKEPELVSIFDLDSLLYFEENRPKYLSPPLATFTLVDGCNFLSLSSTGTRLITSSRKGEISTVWDLHQLVHGIPERMSSHADLESTSPCIKQLQRVSRSTPSTVIDCAWSRDDDAIAILTAHGTVHLHEVPQRPRPPKRPQTKALPAPAPEKADATVSLSAGMSPPSANQGFLGSIKSGWLSVSTQVNSIRTTNPAMALGLPTTFAGFREATAAAGNAGSRAVARGLSQGYTAAKGGASDYWHADDNKIRHTKALQEPFAAKSLRWVRRNNTTSVVISCGGNVHVHPVQRVTRRKGNATISGLKNERYAHKAFPLPPITTKSEAGGLQNINSCLGQGPHGFWSLRPSPGTTDRKSNMQFTKLLHGQDDVESNPPYCPFHVDSRPVNIFAFDGYDGGSQYGPSPAYDDFQIRGHGLQDEEPWSFGQPLPPNTKINEYIDDDELHDVYDSQGEEDEEDGIASQVESKLTIQTARKSRDSDQINIRSRRRQGRGGIRGEGEFELLEDDDSIA